MAGKFNLEAILSGKDRLSPMLRGVEGRLGRFSSAANSAFGKVTKASRGFAQGLSNVSDRFGERFMPSIKSIGFVGAAAGAVASAALLDVVKVGSDFEDTLVRAAVKLGGIRKGSAAFEELRASAEKAGATTEFSAQQAAGALKAFAGGGLDAAQAMAALPRLIDFASVAEINDLEEGADVLMKTLGALGLKAKDPIQLEKNFARVSDVLARTSDATSANISNLYQSILEGGPIATTAGANIETLSAILGKLADSGIEASVAGTTAKNFFLSLANPAGEAAATLSKFGIATVDANGNMVDAIAILGQLEKATAKLGTAEKATALESIFGKIPLAGVSSLVGQGSFDELTKLRKDLESAAGSTGAQAGIIRTDSPKMKIDELTSAWDGLKTAIFGVIGQPVGDAMKSVTDSLGESTSGVTGFFREAVPFVKEFVGALGDGFREAWPAIQGALGVLFDGFGGKPTWMNSVKEFAGLLGKIAAGAVGVAVVVGGMLAAGLQMATAAVNILIGAWSGMIAGIGNAILWIDDFGASVSAFWDSLISGAGAAATGLIDGLVNGIKGGARWVVEAIQNLGAGAMDALKSLLGISSPSKVFAGYGGNVVDGFVKGLDPLSGTLADAMPELPMIPAPKFEPFEGDPLAELDRIRMMPPQFVEAQREEAEDEAASGASRRPVPQIASPTEAITRSFAESKSEHKETVQLDIKAPPGVATVKRPRGGGAVPIKVTESGAFDRRGG